MKKILGLKAVLNLTLIVLLVGGMVYSLGFGICMYLARQEVTKESHEKVDLALSYIQNYVDGQLQRVEDVGYTLLSSKFGLTTRDDEGNAFVTIDPNSFVLPGEEEIFDMLEHFINSNPHICGVAIGFEKFVYPNTAGEYGFAAYVTNVSGKNERLRLGEIHDYHEKEWYSMASKTNKPYWSKAFRETSMNEMVTCYSIPLHGIGNRLVGVLALDINTEKFREKCNEANPFSYAEVAIVDREMRFVSHPDSSYLLRSVEEVEEYRDYRANADLREKIMGHEAGKFIVNEGTDHEAFFSVAPIARNGWTISIESPVSEVYGGVNRMKRDTTFIAVVSILVMLICFIFFFRRLNQITMSKAGIESELKIASAIQMGMLPKLYPAFPDRKELDVYGFLKPAKSVGGDLYDYFIRDNKLFFCIGDVSGKGVPASLYMAVIRSLFRNVSLHEDDPSKILESLNTALSEGNDHNMFCTMFLGVLDLTTGHLDYSNAGHNPPIVRRLKDDGSVDVYYTKPEVNLAIGVFPDFPYKKEETTMKPGEAIFLYTDGVTEAESATKQLFGEEATLKALAKARKEEVRSAKDFINHVYHDLQVYTAGNEQSDDITMVVVEYRGVER